MNVLLPPYPSSENFLQLAQRNGVSPDDRPAWVALAWEVQSLVDEGVLDEQTSVPDGKVGPTYTRVSNNFDALPSKGARVRHVVYGHGTVIDVSTSSLSPIIKIQFDDVGKKELAWNMAHSRIEVQS